MIKLIWETLCGFFRGTKEFNKLVWVFKTKKKTHRPIYYDQFRIGDNWLSTNKEGFSFAFDEEIKFLTCFKKKSDGTIVYYDVGNYDADLISDGHKQSDKVWLITVYQVPRFACELCRE